MKKEKIAIMTWYTYDNYGSVLQAYALKNKIEQLGYEKVDLINYLPRSRKIRLIKRINKRNIYRKFLLHSDKIKKLVIERKEKFENFRKTSFTYTDKCNNATDLFNLNKYYDKFICGSDQIWAPTVFDENYFLDFVCNNSKKIAYAPSIGLNSIENKYIKEKMKTMINKIDSASIREEQGKKIIQDFRNEEDIKVVLDPTLLLNKIEWNKQFGLETQMKEYVVFYCLGRNNRNYNIAKRIAKKLKRKLIVIPADILDYKKNNINNASPEEFLKLIYNAYLVLTDSFHGTIFSINFNVPFITFKRFKENKFSQNSRIYNILKTVNLEERIYNNNEKYFLENIKIDFEKSNFILEKERKKSICFLEQALKKKATCESENIITNICAGCGVCAMVCPKRCIDIMLNDKGFYNYVIDEAKCIKCGKCKKVCGQLNNTAESLKNMTLYSGYSLDKDILKISSSGGIAYEVSLLGMQFNLPVIGCKYDINNNRAEHIVITNNEEISKLAGSKYLQSYTKDAFEKLKDIKKGIVIGTPCQISSVDNYLNSIGTRESFILIDLICHGVPTYYLWQKYINNFGEIKNIKFRDKKYGWKNKTMTINCKYHKKETKNLFYDAFRAGIVFNKSCYECKYRTETSADIRIGDYWGPKFKRNHNGVSMICVNTRNGKKLLDYLAINKRIVMKKQPIEDYYNIQQTINKIIPEEYEKMIDDLKNDKTKLKEFSTKYCKNKLRYNKMINLLIPVYNKLKGKKDG